MKQIVRRVVDRRGRVTVIDLPEPHLGPDQILVHNHYSLISSGTEMSTLAKTPAELVRQTLSDPWMRQIVTRTILSAGPARTAQRVWQEMIMPREIGYSGAGRVLEVGSQVEGFTVGQKVAYAATGHAELVAPAINHIVPVPEEVDLQAAAFVTVGGIAIQALRRAELQFGETVAIYGLGLVGQICARIAKAAGCVVVGIDIDDARNRIALAGGVDVAINPATSDLDRRVMDLTGKHGVDATIICASSQSAEIVNSAMAITRRQGRVVLVGYVKLDIHPKNFLYREIDLRYSRAFGPGSYHRGYEKGRLDYPFGYVRWTEKRNLAEFVRLVSSGAVDVRSLIGGLYTVERAQEAFDAIAAGTLGGIAALIDYGAADHEPDRRRTIPVRPSTKARGELGISVIGCGSHFLSEHLPSLKSMRGVQVRHLASKTGKNASMVAASLGANTISSDVDEVLADPDTDAVIISSTHPEHCGHIAKAIAAGKAIYVEKPMVSSFEELRQVARLMRDHPVLFTLGLNRRYSPVIDRLRKELVAPPYAMQYTINQAFIPPDHWTLDEIDGGGRLLGEGEHFIDLCHLLIGQRPLRVEARALGTPPEDLRRLANFSITIHYATAQASIVFAESAAASHPREQLTIMAPGQVAVVEDFSRLTVFGRKKRALNRLGPKGMGHREAHREFVAALRGEPNRMLGWEEALLASLTMFAAQESLLRGVAVDLAELESRLDAEDDATGEASNPQPES